MPDVKFSNLYPYTDFHELNLDWVIKTVSNWRDLVGKTIQSINKTGTAGLVDTYTITYSDGSTSTFDVTNGNGIASVAKTGTVGLVDTYTITFQDGSTSTFEVTNGTAAVDPTLTLPDYAADAKATGDMINELDGFLGRINDYETPFGMELGNITFSSTSATYSSSSSRVRNPASDVYYVNEGDVIGFQSYDNITYYVGIEYAPNTLLSRGWLTTDYTAERSGRLYLLARYTTESPITNISVFKPFVRQIDTRIDTLQTQMADAQSDIERLDSNVYALSNKIIYPKLIAHAGFSSLYPEDTVVSAMGAKKYGFKITETDLRITSDGYFVCCHDATVDRTTDGTGTISNMTLSQVKACNIDLWGAYGSLTWNNLKIPTIEEFLETCISLDLVPMMEIRQFTDGQRQNLLDIIRQYNLEETAIIESFYDTDITWFRSNSDIMLAALLDPTDENIDYCASIGNCLLAINATNNNPTQTSMDYANSKNVPVLAWTINANPRIQELSELGVKYIITDKQINHNNISPTYPCAYKTLPDVNNNNPDNWGFRFYVGDMITSYSLPCTLNKTIVHLYCEVFSAGDPPELKICGNKIPIKNSPNEWQTIDFAGVMFDNSEFSFKQTSSNVNVQMKNISMIFIDV